MIDILNWITEHGGSPILRGAFVLWVMYITLCTIEGIAKYIMLAFRKGRNPED